MRKRVRRMRAHNCASLVAAVAVAVGVAFASLASTAAASSSVGKMTITDPTVCGQNIVDNHSGTAFDTLSKPAQKIYDNFPYAVNSTPWTTFKGKKGPWKVGFVSLPINNPWEVTVYKEIKKEFAAAKAKGIVTGQLQTYIQTDSSTATPEQQDAAIEQMVRSGVNFIMLHADDADAEGPAIDYAGRHGVPVVQLGDVSTTSKYSINFFAQNNSVTYAETLGLMKKSGLIGKGKTVNVLQVRGIPGFAVEEGYYNDSVADLKPCPGINVVGTVWGQWNPSVAKTQILSFLAAHPETINLVFQSSVGSGVIEAFQEAGKPLPVMNFGGTVGGDLSYWVAHKSQFNDSVAGLNGGFQIAYSAFHIGLRVLAGDGLKVNSIAANAIYATNANVATYAYAGKPLTFLGDIRGPVTGIASNSDLNLYFNKPGSPDNF